MKKEITRQSPSTVFEGMTSIRAVINGHSLGINDRTIEKILIDKSRKKAKSKEISYLCSIKNEYGFDIEFCSSDIISEIATGTSHGGICAICSERTINSLNSETEINGGFWVMLEGIEDPYNFGYALRTLYATGADGVILSPRNWLSAAGVVCRSSAGASEMLPCYVSKPENAVSTFKSKGFKICAAGIRNSTPSFDADLKKPIFITVGGEKRGISSSLLSMCDLTVRLEYGREFNGSLSAASAASILAYEVLRQNRT